MWNPAALTDLDRLAAVLRALPGELARHPLPPPSDDPDALADACERVDALNSTVELALAVLQVAEATGDRATVRRIGPLVGPADDALWDQVDPWMTLVASWPESRFRAVVSHPRLRDRAESLRSGRTALPDLPPHPHHQRLESRLGPVLPDLADPSRHQAAADKVTAWLERHAEATAAAYAQVLTAHLQAVDVDTLVRARIGIDRALLQQILDRYAEQVEVVQRAARTRAAATGAAVTVASRLVATAPPTTVGHAVDAARSAAGRLGGRAAAALARVLDAPGTVWLAPDAPGPKCLVTPPRHAPMVTNPFDGSSRARSQTTHELFHGMHQWLLGDDVPPAATPSLTVAEGHAALGELLAADPTSCPEVDGSTLLCDVTVAALWKPAAAARLELAALERVAAGEALTAGWLAGRWADELAAIYGDAWRATAGDGHWWALDPQLWTRPALAGAYAAGGAAAATVAAAVRYGDGDRVDAWLGVLRRGGSRSADTLLADAGLTVEALGSGLAAAGGS